jgi:A/G-specific adenine glycosylase
MPAEALLDWYGRVRRPLPWRFTRDPYALLVSEVMLQQTQAARVVPYYEAWLARWPDAAALAAAPAAEVLAAWSGLGYNRRALALQAAARVVARQGWPEDLRELPGVGEYTAAAVASFAFGAQVVAVDTNVRRVLARHGGRLAPPAGRAAEFNQAMMELGATVCTARRARCGACPVEPTCERNVAPPPARRPRERFQDTDRFLRGRVVAAVLAGEALPAADPARLERVLAGLHRDGLIARAADGAPTAP